MFRPSILLVRHGETDDNANKVFQGQGGRGLNARGRFQAERLAERLSKARVEAIYASDLERAMETAMVVAIRHDLPLRIEKDLREVNVGAWTGLSYAEIEERYPEEWDAWRRGLDVRRGGGETYEEFGARMMDVLARIAAAHERPVVCVSHGGAIRSVLHRVLGNGLGLRAIAPADNVGITLLDRDTTTHVFRLAVYNDTNHLEDAVLARL